MAQIVETYVIPNEANIDPDVLRHMNNLGCLEDREKLVAELMSSKHNAEMMVYFLLLDRKRRKPAQDDDNELALRGTTHLYSIDPPRKRTDTSRPRLPSNATLADGSPINPRKSYSTANAAGGWYGVSRNRHSSLGGSPNGSPRSSPRFFHSARGGNQASAAADALALMTGRTAGRDSSTTSISSNASNSVTTPTTRANNYHYYTQPVDPVILAAAASSRQSRVSRKDQHQSPKKTPYSTAMTASQYIPGTPPGSTHISPRVPNIVCKKLSTDSALNPVNNSAASSSNSLASGGSQASNLMTMSTTAATSNHSGTGPWRTKISNTIKNSILGTPRFHRRKFSGGPGPGGSSNGNGGESDSEECLMMLESSDLVKKSRFGSLTSSIAGGSENDNVQCEHVQDKSLNEIKAELIRTFLTIHELSHAAVIDQNSFIRTEYKSTEFCLPNSANPAGSSNNNNNNQTAFSMLFRSSSNTNLSHPASEDIPSQHQQQKAPKSTSPSFDSSSAQPSARAKLRAKLNSFSRRRQKTPKPVVDELLAARKLCAFRKKAGI